MTLQHAESVLSLSAKYWMWFADADEWYEALARVMAERAPA